MKGLCLCGAIDCKSCGPAQGYRPCPACGGYGNVCEHYDADTGELTDEGIAAQIKNESVSVWEWEKRIAAQREDIGPDPRELDYWARLM